MQGMSNRVTCCWRNTQRKRCNKNHNRVEFAKGIAFPPAGKRRNIRKFETTICQLTARLPSDRSITACKTSITYRRDQNQCNHKTLSETKRAARNDAVIDCARFLRTLPQAVAQLAYRRKPAGHAVLAPTGTWTARRWPSSARTCSIWRRSPAGLGRFRRSPALNARAVGEEPHWTGWRFREYIERTWVYWKRVDLKSERSESDLSNFWYFSKSRSSQLNAAQRQAQVITFYQSQEIVKDQR